MFIRSFRAAHENHVFSFTSVNKKKMKNEKLQKEKEKLQEQKIYSLGLLRNKPENIKSMVERGA